MIDKVYVINLKYRDNRMTNMDKILNKIGGKISEYERIDAVNERLIC